MFRLKSMVLMGMMLVVLSGGVYSSLWAGAGSNLIVIKGNEFKVPNKNTLTAWVETERWRGSVRADLSDVENNCTPVTVEIPEEGEYYLWVNTTTGSGGVTQYKVVIDEKILTEVFGNFERDSTKWERVGPIKLAKGKHKLELYKIGNGAVLCNAIVLTQDKNYIPPTNLELLFLPQTIINPGFEEDKDGNGIPDGWKKTALYKSTPEFIWDSNVKRSGKYSASIINDDVKDVGMWQQRIRLEPNTRYEFVLYVKGENITGDRGTRVQIWYINKDGKSIKPEYCSSSLTGTFDWKRVVHTFTTPSGTVAGDFSLVFLRATGRVWFDDLSLKKLGEEKKVLAPPLPILPVEMTTITTKRPTFRWNNRYNVATYILEIASDRNFTQNVIKIKGIKPSREDVLDEKNDFAITQTEYTLSKEEALDYGKWYWRVSYITKSGQKSLLSAVRSFEISREDKDQIAYSEKKEHPYLYFTKDDIPRIKAKIESSPMYRRWWKNILFTANTIVKYSVPIPDEETLDKNGQHGHYLGLTRRMRRELETLGFAYVMTGDTKFAQKAKERMLELARLKRWVGPYFVNPKRFSPPWLSALETGEICKAVATCYDWIYDYLTPQERKTIREALIEKGIKPLRTWFDPELYSKIPRHQIPCGNWHMVCNGGAGVAALAVLYEEPEAEKWVRQVRDNVRWWLNYKGGDYIITDCYSRSKVKAVVGPLEPNFGPDGGYLESLGYLNYAMVYASYFATSLKKITGEDLYRYVPSNITDSIIYMLYESGKYGGNFTTPEFGDTGGSLAFTELYSALIGEKKDRQAQWLFKKLIINRENVWDAHSLLWYDENVPASPPPTDKWAKHFRRIGWVILRSGWGLRENMLAIKYHQNRGHHDLGTFDLYAKGQKLIVDSGCAGYASPVYRNYLRWTEAHNVVMVDGERQKRTNGQVLDFIKSPTYAYTVGDITSAYEDILNKWQRHVLFLYPDYYVMIDELRSDEPRKYEYLIHPQESFKINSDNVILTTKYVSLLIKMAEPVKTEVKVADGYIHTKPAKYLRIAPEKLHKDVNFVTILYPYYASKGEPDFKVIRKDNVKGFEVRREEGKDIILYSDKNNIRYGDIISDGKIAVISWDGEGRISRYALHQGTTLRYGKIISISSSSIISAGISYNPDIIQGTIKLAKSSKVNLYCPFEVKTVFVDGSKEKCSFDKRKNLVTLSLSHGEHEVVMTDIKTTTIPIFKIERRKEEILSAPTVNLER